jgi:hypothetical protein
MRRVFNDKIKLVRVSVWVIDVLDLFLQAARTVSSRFCHIHRVLIALRGKEEGYKQSRNMAPVLWAVSPAVYTENGALQSKGRPGCRGTQIPT